MGDLQYCSCKVQLSVLLSRVKDSSQFLPKKHNFRNWVEPSVGLLQSTHRTILGHMLVISRNCISPSPPLQSINLLLTKSASLLFSVKQNRVIPSFDIMFSCFSFFQGINFQLAAVLISIGTYAYIEHGEWLLTYTVHEPATVKLEKMFVSIRADKRDLIHVLSSLLKIKMPISATLTWSNATKRVAIPPWMSCYSYCWFPFCPSFLVHYF